MSRKHAELEREFIDELANRTGRTLAEWMTAIDGTGITDRNAIIDWLRPQGLTFAHASWLERIHHNGGRPIYVGTPATQPLDQPVIAPRAAAPKPAPQPRLPVGPAGAATRPLVHAPAPPAPASPANTSGEPIATLLARGKGLKPLADMVLREIARAVPASTAAAAGDIVVFTAPAAFAVLQVGPKELRLGLALPGATPMSPVQPTRIAGAPPAITHMFQLNDARQVNNTLIDLVVLANGKTNPT